MRAFAEWSPKVDPHFNKRRILAFDLDDTLTTQGTLPSEICAALEECQKRDWITLLVTGRPASWADALTKLLAFDGAVAENGALIYFWPEKKSARKTHQESRKLYWTTQGYQTSPPQGLQSAHENAQKKILEAVPKARVASDQGARLYDLAIDFAEEVDPPLALSEAEKIRDVFLSLGAQAKISSIHVNGYWGSFSKASALQELIEKEWSLSLRENLIYIGDSPNDSPLFEKAGMSVGVANIKRFIGKSEFYLPQYITQEESSLGSLEVLHRVLKLKQ